jgi:azurin
MSISMRFFQVRSILVCSVLLSAGLSVPLAQTAAPAAAPAQAPAAKGSARTVEISSSDTMKYSVTSITAKRGEALRIVLKATGAMPKIAMQHNVVILQADADATAFANAAATARATDYIPAAMKDKVLANTPLAANGDTVEVTFTAPAKAGAYTYLCTFPGHFQSGMKGTLVVK